MREKRERSDREGREKKFFLDDRERKGRDAQEGSFTLVGVYWVFLCAKSTINVSFERRDLLGEN